MSYIILSQIYSPDLGCKIFNYEKKDKKIAILFRIK